MKRLAVFALILLFVAGCAGKAARDKPAAPSGLPASLRITDVQIAYAPGANASDRLQILISSALLGKLVQRADVSPGAKVAVVSVQVQKVRMAGKSGAWTLGVVGGKSSVQATVQVTDAATKDVLNSFQVNGEYGSPRGDAEKEIAERFSSDVVKQLSGKAGQM